MDSLRREVFNDSLSIDQLLGEESGSSKHRQATILEFLGLHKSKFLGIRGLQAKGVKFQVARDVFLAQKTGLVVGDVLGFDPADFGTDGFGLCDTSTQEDPENGVHLGKVGDGRASDFTVEKESLAFDGFSDEETDGGQHGDAAVSELSFTVTLKGGFISLGGEASGVKKTYRGKGTGDCVDGESLLQKKRFDDKVSDDGREKLDFLEQTCVDFTYRSGSLGSRLLEGVESSGRRGEKGKGGSELHGGVSGRGGSNNWSSNFMDTTYGGLSEKTVPDH
jgi:hypothetical protein